MVPVESVGCRCAPCCACPPNTAPGASNNNCHEPECDVVADQNCREKLMTFMDQCRTYAASAWKAYEHHPWIEAMARDELPREKLPPGSVE